MRHNDISHVVFLTSRRLMESQAEDERVFGLRINERTNVAKIIRCADTGVIEERCVETHATRMRDLTIHKLTNGHAVHVDAEMRTLDVLENVGVTFHATDAAVRPPRFQER